eukprot:gene5800-11097_t
MPEESSEGRCNAELSSDEKYLLFWGKGLEHSMGSTICYHHDHTLLKKIETEKHKEDHTAGSYFSNEVDHNDINEQMELKISVEGSWNFWALLLMKQRILVLVLMKITSSYFDESFQQTSGQQGGNSDNPTPVQFKRAYRKLFHTNLIQIVSGNCEADEDQPLQNLPCMSDVTVPQQLTTQAPLKLIIAEDYFQKLLYNRLLKDNAIAYVAGFLLRKAFSKHDCKTCRSSLVNATFDDERKNFLFFKAYESDTYMFGGLVFPSDIMINYVIKLEDAFLHNFTNIDMLQDISYHLLQILMAERLQIPCNDFPKDDLNQDIDIVYKILKETSKHIIVSINPQVKSVNYFPDGLSMRIVLPRVEEQMLPKPVQALFLLAFVLTKVASLLQAVGVLCAHHRKWLLPLFYQLATAQVGLQWYPPLQTWWLWSKKQEGFSQRKGGVEDGEGDLLITLC